MFFELSVDTVRQRHGSFIAGLGAVFPYEKPIAAHYEASAVMMANVVVPGLTCALDDHGCEIPATLSPDAYALLRDRYGWAGLVMTDTLQTKAVVGAHRTMGDAIVAAIAAGADMVMFKPAGGQPSVATYREQLAAVRDAVLAWVADDPEDRTARIARSVERIRAAKASISDP